MFYFLLNFRPRTRTVGCNSMSVHSVSVSCGTVEPSLMKTSLKGITIEPSNEQQNLRVTTIKGITIAPTSEDQNLKMTAVKGITIAPSASPERELRSDVPLLSLRDMNKQPIVRTNATQTYSPSTHQQGTQASPAVINKATDANDLIRLVHKTSMTEVAQKRDQIVHTGDLIKVLQIGTNTPHPVMPVTRSTASNTDMINVKSVGINVETSMETIPNNQGNLSLNNLSKIPRPSPMAQRKFVRQDTFTVSTMIPVETPPVRECPAEAALK